MADTDVSAGDEPKWGGTLAPPGRRGWRGLRAKVPTPLLLILIVGAFQSVAWDVAVPAFQGPDESAHYAYIQYLAETGNLPRVPPPETAERVPGSTEEQDALTSLNLRSVLRNPYQRPAWSAVDVSLWHRVEHSMPSGSRARGAESNRLAKNPPLYYAVMAIPYRMLVWLPLLKRVFVLRLFNALFYLTTIVLVWLIAGELFGPVRWKQTLTAGTVALEPQLGFLSAIINADNLLIALTTGLLLASLRLVKRGPSLGRTVTPSVLAAAAVLTHGRGLVTLPVLAAALVVSWIRHRPGARDALILGGASAATVGVAFLGYLVFGRGTGSSALYGGQVRELNGGHGFKLSQFLSTVYQFYLPKLASIPKRIGARLGFGYRQMFIESFYGNFGSLDVAMPRSVYDTMQVLSALGLLGFYTAVVVRWRQLRRCWPVVVVMLALLLTMIGFLHYVSYRALVDSGGHNPLIIGRYLLPMIPLFGLAIAFTAGSLPRRWGPVVGAAVLAVGALLCLAGIGETMARYYA